MTRALVTGGLGFLGSHLVDALLCDGCEVTIVDDCSSHVVEPDAYAGRCRVDVAPVEASPPGGPPFDEIYHLAERAGPAGILPYAGTLGLRSALGLERVLRLAVPGRTRLLYVSSSEVYGKPGRFTEGEAKVVPSPYTVRLEYALAKMLAEATLLNGAAARDIRVNVVRPFNIAGPRQSSAGGFVLPRFFEAALSGASLTVFGHGRQIRSLTHVLDTVDSLIAVMRSDAHGLILNSGNPANVVSIVELARRVRSLCESDSPITFVDPRSIYGPLYAEAFDKVPDITRITAVVGWAPRRSLADILRDTLGHHAPARATRGGGGRGRRPGVTARFETLIVSPHADDEVLGCASVLGRDTFVLYLGVDDFHVVDREARLAEIAAVSAYFGFSWSALTFPVNRYYTELLAIVQAIEGVVGEVRPHRAFIPSPSYNQDHVTVSRACRTALRRHDRIPFVPQVLGYEEPDGYLGDSGDGPPFEANYFRPLDVERKLSGYRLHASQVRAHRSETILRGMAAHRGAQSMLPAAEAFHLVRWVDRSDATSMGR